MKRNTSRQLLHNQTDRCYWRDNKMKIANNKIQFQSDKSNLTPLFALLLVNRENATFLV